MLLDCRCYLSFIFVSGALAAKLTTIVDEDGNTARRSVLGDATDVSSLAEQEDARTVTGAEMLQTPGGTETGEMPKNIEQCGKGAEGHCPSSEDVGGIDSHDSSQWFSALNMSSERTASSVGHCAEGFWGKKCKNKCPSGCYYAGCHSTTGHCHRDVCQTGRYGARYDEPLMGGGPWGGAICHKSCPEGCSRNQCNMVSGYCFSCKGGLWGWYYPVLDASGGLVCNKKCSEGCAHGCNSVSGECLPSPEMRGFL